MTAGTTAKKKWPFRKTVIISVVAILSIAAVLLYNNFNRLLSNALINGFNSNVISDVYELKFEKLRVNFFEASIRVFNVTLHPREKPLRSYPYINSSLRLTTIECCVYEGGVHSLCSKRQKTGFAYLDPFRHWFN